MQYVQVVRQHLPSGQVALRFNIDATLRGNVARFVNHRCGDPSAVLVIVWRSGEYMPVVALASRRALRIGEEVTWTYGEASNHDPGQQDATCGAGQPVLADGGDPAVHGQHDADSMAGPTSREVCLCGSDLCTGFMPLR